MFSHPTMRLRARGQSIRRANDARIVVMKAEGTYVGTVQPGPATPVAAASPVVWRAPWPGLKPLVRAAVGG